MTDTVGLIRRLPHHLVEAFKSTLEEASNSDLILNVVDVSSNEYEEHLEVTNNLLSELGCDNIPKITVYNKCDKCSYCNILPTDDTNIKISAKKQLGFQELLKAICINLPETAKRFKLLIPYDKSNLISKIRMDGKIFSEEYKEEGTLIDALVDIKILYEVKPFIIE